MQVRDANIVIATSTTISSVFAVSPGDVIVGIQISDTFDGTAITLQNSIDGGATYETVKDIFSNTLSIAITDDTGGYYAIDPTLMYGMALVKFIAGTAQVANETIKVATVKVG